jgi:polar amino acid transport system substrate-binding protein
MLLAGRVEAALLDVASARYLIAQQDLSERVHVDDAAIAPGRLYLGFSRQRGMARWAEPFGAALRAYKRKPGFARLLAGYGLRPADVTDPQA